MDEKSYSYSKSSLNRLSSCHPVLQHLFRLVIRHRDCSITCGHRSDKEQDALYAIGRTKPGDKVTNAKAGKSKHNTFPSTAIDVVPYPEKWSDNEAFLDLHHVIIKCWNQIIDNNDDQGFNLVWGGDWDSDGDRGDQTFNDLPHYELVKGLIT